MVSDVKILIFNKNRTETLHLNKLCSRLGKVDRVIRTEDLLPLVQSKTYTIAIIDHTEAYYSSVGALFDKTTGIIITGPKGKKIKEVIHTWPRDRYVDFVTSPFYDDEPDGLERALKKAIKHACLLNEVNDLRQSNEEKNHRLNRILIQIKDINSVIQEAFVAQIEKRASIQKQYDGLKKERQKVEDILKRLYTANDITSLIDIVFDIKEIVRSKGISIYLMDENETVGKFLKPLVWNDTILSYPDFTKSVVTLHSQDFAAFSARNAQKINTASPQTDSLFSNRYASQLNYPLESILCVPIKHDEEVIGLLEVYNKTDEDGSLIFFNQEDQQILLKLCEHISIAITKLNLIQFDALTGLLRPDPFFEKVIQKLKIESKRHQEDYCYAMVMGDVDWFKNYNDKLGHSAGNKLLRDLAQLLKSSMREEDLLCRFGGEEFLFFLTSIKSREEAFIITERLRRKVSEQYFEGQEILPRRNLTMSFGITNFTKSSFKTSEAITKSSLKKIVDEADMALAVAKGKRKTFPFLTDDASTTGRDKNNISVYAEDDLEKREEFKQTKPPAGAPDRSPLREKNTITIFSENEDREAIKMETIPPHLISNSQDRRKFRRFLNSSLVIFNTNENEKVCKTVDLSMGGTKIRTKEEMKQDEIINLTLVLGNKAIKAKGDVVYSKRSGEQELFCSGIKFLDFPVSHRESLKAYLSSLTTKTGNAL
jgi:diguanylate cyclase (GGDEF)-like protein